MASNKRSGVPLYYIGMVLLAVFAVSFVYNKRDLFSRNSPSSGPNRVDIRLGQGAYTDLLNDLSGPTLEEIQAAGLIRDVHEHIASLDLAPKYLAIMDELGIKSMSLMGSSKFTLTLNEAYGFTEVEENNAELIRIAKAYPGRFEAWPTMDPEDPDKLAKFEALVREGAAGLKLYIGHGFVTKGQEYMFHTVAIDDPGMLPVYAFCQERFIPIVMHVNPYDDGSHKGKPGFAEEFDTVLSQFPDLKIIAPHFILSSISVDRLREYLDAYPNLMSDVSFGDFFAKAGLARISKNPEKYRKLLSEYPDRFMYAADLVLIQGARQNEEWLRTQLTAYLDMLSKETYTSSIVEGKKLNGLHLPGHMLERVLYKNYEDFMARKPSGTKPVRPLDWSRINPKRDPQKLDRAPGQHFPPRKKPA